MPHQFEHDVGVAVDAWKLSLLRELLEHLVDVGHVEVSTKTEIFGTPVVATQERMDEGESTLARSGIAKMSHEEFSRKVIMGARENLRDGILALCLFTKHIFLSWHSFEVDGSDARSLLSSVVLLLHHQIELVQSVVACTIFLLIILNWFQ